MKKKSKKKKELTLKDLIKALSIIREMAESWGWKVFVQMSPNIKLMNVEIKPESYKNPANERISIKKRGKAHGR